MSNFSLIAVPRKWVKDWMLEILTIAFGATIPTKQPFRLIFFKEVTGGN